MMTPASLPGRRALTGSVLSIVCLLSAGLSAGQVRNPFRGDRAPTYQTFKDPAGRFELDYPTKDWRPLPTGGSSLAVFASKDGPTLVIDHVRMRERLTPGEIEAMAEGEIGRIKDNQPKAKDFKPEKLESKAGRGVLIRYSRDGSGPEVVVQGSIPVGQDLFRLNGVIPEKQLSKFDSIIIHMIESFKTPAEPAAAKK
jgi:hypothetical protein